MIVQTSDGEHRFKAASFETDEHNNLCIYLDNRCVKAFAAGSWTYVEVETDG